MRRRSGHPITAPSAATRDDAWPPIGTDATIVVALDGVLYHESDLDLEEHYTDTHGYTEIDFAAFGMVGMRFCPRIRSLHHQRITAPTRTATTASSSRSSSAAIGR